MKDGLRLMVRSKVSDQNAKLKVGQIAAAMLEGSIPYLKGAIELTVLREELGIYANDPDFFVFVGLLAEIDQLPLGRNLQNWTDDNVVKYQQVISESEVWAKEFTLSQCKSLASRFKT